MKMSSNRPRPRFRLALWFWNLLINMLVPVGYVRVLGLPNCTYRRAQSAISYRHICDKVSRKTAKAQRNSQKNAIHILDFSVQPLCSVCLCGYRNARYNNHRDTENTEVAQRRSRRVEASTVDHNQDIVVRGCADRGAFIGAVRFVVFS